MRFWTSVFILLCAAPLSAETLYATRTMRVGEIVAPQDLVLRRPDRPGSYSDPAQVIGQEMRATVYAGHPMRVGDVGRPALVQRNALVLLVFEGGGLRITSEGRSLSRGAVGDRVRVMNLTSRASLFGVVHSDGTVHVKR
ncbi:MAG: flagellar basal body P-ring formation protein FlgA [Rhodobacteraceae bacterium]|nr:flagellar basal body P-ring formation protein FlgA [Paracoccaceae bacterium]